MAWRRGGSGRGRRGRRWATGGPGTTPRWGNPTRTRALGQAALRSLMAYGWPGNIRELENAIEYAVAMSGDALDITPDLLPEEIRSPGEASFLSTVTIPDEGLNFTALVSQLERELITRALEKTLGNKRQAAGLLNLSRTTLIDKLHRLCPQVDTPAA